MHVYKMDLLNHLLKVDSKLYNIYKKKEKYLVFNNHNSKNAAK